MKFIAIILVFSLIAGCDLFQTRDAQKPDQPRSNYQQAVTPDILLANFINSMKDKNLQNYLACFTDTAFAGKSYSFVPSSSSIPRFPTMWEKRDESNYFTNLKSYVPTDLPIIVALTNATSNTLGPDSMIYAASYSLSVPFTDTKFPSYYQGDLKFYLIRDSRSVWSIYLWMDIINQQYPSWSELKGRLY